MLPNKTHWLTFQVYHDQVPWTQFPVRLPGGSNEYKSVMVDSRQAEASVTAGAGYQALVHHFSGHFPEELSFRCPVSQIGHLAQAVGLGLLPLHTLIKF